MTSSPAPPGKARGKIWQKIALSLVPAVLLGWWMQGGALKIVPPSEELARVASWTIPAYLAVWLSMYFVRLSRWYWLLVPVERVPMRTVLRVGAIGLFAIALLPLRMGEVVRPLLIRKPPKLTFWSASGTVGGERVLDLFSVSVLLLLSLRLSTPLSPLPDHIGTLPIDVGIVPRAALAFALVAAAGSVTMALFYFQRAWARRMTERTVGLVSPRLALWLAAKLEQAASGLGFLAYPKLALPFLLATVAYWLLNASTFWVLALGCNIESIGFWGSVTTMGVVALGIIVPATPGFFGAFQFATYAGLAVYLAPEVVTTRGSAYAFLGYVLPVGMSALTGLVAVLANPRALSLLTGDGGDPPAAVENLARPGEPS